ncbi:MAG: response regulator transcription factor [Thiovulaceae bacterium]|nr:response regulator transcription factor [Sulfurimonadaceae bacterium]
MKKNILIVEDEEQIAEFISNRLDANLYNVDIAYEGRDALCKIHENTYDLITLDIMIPHINGFEIIEALRKKSKQTLVIMISALDTEEFKEKGYELGVDDYIAKPFSAKELSVKIKSLLKRREELNSANSKYISNIILNEESCELIINGFKMSFTPSEYFLLSVLVNNKKRVYSRNELAQLIYDNNFGEIDERSIDSHIYHIRKKAKIFETKEIIKTVRGIGYQINED